MCILVSFGLANDWLYSIYIILIFEDIHKFHFIICAYLYFLDGWLMTSALILFPNSLRYALDVTGCCFPRLVCWQSGEAEFCRSETVQE